MTEVQQTSKKGRVQRSLAVVGFIGIIILIAWLSIQLINVMPSAFSSLASLAEVVQRGEKTATTTPEVSESKFIQVSSDKTLLSTGDPVTVSWAAATKAGSHTFSYRCVPGVAITVLDNENISAIDCETTYNLGNATSLTLTIESEKERYTDVQYTIAFLGTNDQNPQASGSASLTIINNAIENILGQAAEETTTPKPEEAEPEAEVVTPQTPTNPPVTTPPVEQQYEYVYEIPTSNPAGRTDLGVRYVAVGTIANNSFSASTLLKQNSTGAIQFIVQNYGTKTSESWKFTVTLPNGTTYTADSQKPLKPNEQTLLTIGFPTTSTATHTFLINVSEPTEQNILNNATTQTVTFVK